MRLHLENIQTCAELALRRRVNEDLAQSAAARCAWLHGAGYNGLKYLAEALQDVETSSGIEKDLMGVDLKGISCVFLFPRVEQLVADHGRVFLRNVRHGLYLLPGSVKGNYGIGCPIDPGFALGGERSKNPYEEKLLMAQQDGVDVDDTLWQSLSQN